MSTLIVNKIQTTNTTTDQTIATGNPDGSKITVYSTLSQITLSGNNTTNNIVITPTSTAITGNLSVSTNTITLGTSTSAANGYTYLPNDIKMNWGAVSTNSSTGDITFANGFTTLYSITVSTVGTVADATYSPILLAANATTANVRTTNATSRTVYYQAIGI